MNSRHRFGPILQPGLHTPVVAEIDGVNVVMEGFVDLGKVIIADGVEQFGDEFEFFIKIHHQVFHAAKDPGPFVKGKPDAKDAPAVGILVNQRGNIREKAGISGIGKRKAVKRGFCKEVVFDNADILIHPPVPDHAEDVAKTVIPKIFEKTDIAAQTEKMVLCRILHLVGAAETLFQFLLNFVGKTVVPGDVRGLFAVKDQANDIAFFHCLLQDRPWGGGFL